MSHASPVPAPPERRRIKEMEAVVVEVVRETPDTTTLVLFTGNERRRIRCFADHLDDYRFHFFDPPSLRRRRHGGCVTHTCLCQFFSAEQPAACRPKLPGRTCA